ncbi:methyltransferase domain-containing protein [Halomarina litorea]|uniref:methyltransferase domain-containing protein n=1 Tax=Halomarina litorea TaxID=2961595 RepID=UPI0020C212B0|nr:methyltransferase domain-containing protein [Halomarina sp. BCD28]
MSEWDADLYESSHGFVHEASADLVDHLDPREDERVLDVGCGTGHLTRRIADRCSLAVGVDRDPAMLARARAEYPSLSLLRGDARALPVSGFDAVFSNAALHWVPEADAGRVAQSVARALAPGGRFVAELGGTGNVAALVSAIEGNVEAAGHDPGPNPWYFPSVGEYAGVLEGAGFEVRLARLFDRPTPLSGEAGLREWVEMFGGSLLAPVPESDRESVLDGVEDRLRDDHYRDGEWVADYRRLRVVAVRPS